MVLQRLVPERNGGDYVRGFCLWQLHNSRRAFGMVKDSQGDVWLTPKEAAKKLNLSVGRIYQLTRFLTHRKMGSSNQGRVFFLESALFDDYMSI